MNCLRHDRFLTRNVGLILGLAVAVFLLAGLAETSQAQSVVVANFSGKPPKLRNQARAAVAKALQKQGMKIVAYPQYLRTAKKSRIRPNRALAPRSIQVIAKKMNLNGVVTGSTTMKRRQFTITVNVFDSSGQRVGSKSFKSKKPVLLPAQAEEIANLVAEKLGGSTAVAEASTETTTETSTTSSSGEVPTEEPPPTDTGTGETTTTTTEGSGESVVPPWARTETTTEGTGSTETATSGESGSGTTETSEVTETAPPSESRRKETGAVPDVLVAAGLSGNYRVGLSPVHNSGLFFGIRADARFFLGTFLDVIVVKDIGFGGFYNQSLGLQYGPEQGGDKWSANQYQWQAEFTYRLALNSVVLQPAFLFRFGYGQTSATIEYTSGTSVRSATYSYPYGALDIYLSLWKPYLRFYLSGGFLFTVAPSGTKFDGASGNGFSVRGGFDLSLFEQFHIGLGYDMTQFLISSSVEEVSDIYHIFFLRLGWNYQ